MPCWSTMWSTKSFESLTSADADRAHNARHTHAITTNGGHDLRCDMLRSLAELDTCYGHTTVPPGRHGPAGDSRRPGGGVNGAWTGGLVYRSTNTAHGER